MTCFSSGLYGLFRLDGAPVASADVAALGLTPTPVPQSAHAIGIDAADARAVHRQADQQAITVLVGDLHATAALAGRLCMAPETPPAALARAALARFGADLPNAMVGEWSLLHWEPGRLTCMSSLARRDRILLAMSGARCAVAADLFRLARLEWVGDTIDEAGLLYALSQGELRGRMGRRTMLAGVVQLLPGESVEITAGGARYRRAELPPQSRWRGTFDDAMDEAEAVLTQVLHDRLSATPLPGVLLSGGLDSSLLAWGTAQTKREGALRLLTSVAPPGSGRPDERAYADLVAETLGGTVHPVWPTGEASMYRPPDHILGGASGPPLANRHDLTDAFQAAARALAVTLLVNGTYGEFSITGSIWRESLRARLRRRLIDSLRLAKATDAFHVRLAPARLTALPGAIRADLAVLPATAPRRPSGAPWGYERGVHRALLHTNEFYPGALRMDFPYRDVRLLRLFASFPTEFFCREGLQRAPARHLLKGRLPDAIRLRTRGAPASPAHFARLRGQAGAARERIATFRKAAVGDWLDLDWLDGALARVGARGARDYGEANEVQLTTIAAEFLTWYRLRR